MKILEQRPRRYDLGINVATAGHAKRIKDDIIKTYLVPGMKMLDVGCGTGSLLICAAKTGADTVGIDISDGMLDIARRNIRENGVGDRVSLHCAGVTEMDVLFKDESFDLVTATLVISELYPDEKEWALNEIQRILKPGGTLVVADEVMPHSYLKKLLYLVIRLPLAFVTYIIAQTSTKAVSDISRDLNQAGFKVINERNSFLGSFSLISARKIPDFKPRKQKSAAVITHKDDFSILKSVWDYTGRWFPNPVYPGLRKIGNPEKGSPVIVTSNFHLSVRRVEKAIKRMDCYLLVVPTNGINVWCAACGHEMNAHSIISTIKMSKINTMVSHRQLILPQLCAPGVDRKLIKQQTGWDSCFGPVYAGDIHEFVNQNFKKTQQQHIAKFPILFRLEALFSMNFLVFVLITIAVFFINYRQLPYITALFWVPGIILYAGYPFIPGGSGWVKAAALAVFEIFAIAAFSVFVLGILWWSHWQWMAAASVMTLWLGFDLKGSVGGTSSEAEAFLCKAGVKSLGLLFTTKGKKIGLVQQDINKCINCRACIDVCPNRVFHILDNNKIRIKNRNKCFGCNACVAQCPSSSLSIR